MACGCKPTITPGTCNRTIDLCRYSPMTVLAVNPVCTTLPYNLTVVGAIGNIIYSIVNDGKSIAINSDETTDELAYITYEYNCNGVQQTCTLTINVQDRIEGTHAIELNACSSTCSLGDTTYLWTGFTEGCVELMPGYLATDCQIKVLVYDDCTNLNNVITLEVCCGACLDGCCQTTTWTWNPPTFNDNCDADCTMYPCTVYDPVTGNCVSTCEECQTCCNVGGQNFVPIVMTCIKVDEQNYTLDFNTFTLTGEWILAKIEDVEENGDCLLVTDYEVFDTSIINDGGDGSMNFIYIDNGHMQITIQTDDIPDSGGAVLVGYKVGDCERWYAFQILALADQTPSNHCLGTFVFNEYVLGHNELADTPIPLCNTCVQSSSSYCADCCDNLGCVKENCDNQPVCSSGECKCFIGQLEVPALPNGCCPAECTENTVIPICSTCVNGVIVPAPVCTAPFILNTNTCLCECPPGTMFSSLDPLEPCINPTNCNIPGQSCDPCFNCVEGVCTPIPCSGVPGMVNNPIGDGTVQNPCCIPDPCPNCIASLEVNKYCTDVLPRRANVSADATNYRIKFTQIQLNYLPFYSQVDCEYEILQAITQTNNLTNTATYEINYTNYVLDWVPVTPSGTTLIIPQSAGNGFLIKCSWKGREVIYEFIFEEGFIGNASTLVSGEYPIQIRKVKDLTCGNVYGVVGDCQATYSWEFTQAELSASGQFITDNPVVISPTGPDAEACVNATTQFNGIVCEETQICKDIDECQGACGCDPCNGGGALFSTISQVSASDTLIFYASVFRECAEGDELPLMFTCAPPTAVEYIAYINSGGDTLPDGCGTLPQMFDSKPACANCGTFNCNVPGSSPDPATQLCGWWLNTALLVPDSLHINGANIEFEILPAVEMIELCFGTNTECGYVCSCTIIENPEYDPEASCNLVANVTSECTEAGYVQALAVHMTGGIGPYTIQYNIDKEDIGGAHTNILPSGGNNGSLSIITSLLDYTLMGFGVDVQGGCLWYDITITDSSSIPCVVNLTACIPCDPEPPLLTVTSVAGTILCNGGTTTVTVSATGGIAPYTGTGTFTVSAGNYSYVVTDANGYSATTAGSVSEPSLLNVTCTKTDSTSSGADDGTATVTASGGTAPYTYIWNTGATTSTITGLVPGNYGGVVTDANGCVDNCGVIITEPVCTLTAALQTTCEGNGIYSTITIENIIVSGSNSGTYDIQGGIGVRTCTGAEAGIWVIDLDNVTGPNIQIPVNGNGNRDVYMFQEGECEYTENCVYYDLTITDVNDINCRTVLSGCVYCLEECTPTSSQWNPLAIPPGCCSDNSVFCALTGTCIDLPVDCAYGTYSTATCECVESLACSTLIITKNNATYSLGSSAGQSFVGAQFYWSITSGPGTIIGSPLLQSVQFANISALTSITVQVVFADSTVCSISIQGDYCDPTTVSADINIAQGSLVDFDVTAELISNVSLLADYVYQLTDSGGNNGQFSMSEDGVTYVNIGAPNFAVIELTQQYYNLFIKYVTPSGTTVIKNVTINPFNGDINSLTIDVVRHVTAQNTADLVVTGTTVTSTAWVVTGNIVIVSGQNTNSIIWSGCDGTITANVSTYCGDIVSNTITIAGCANAACTPPTINLTLVPAYEGAVSIFAAYPVVDWNGNLPTSITWSETDPNSAVTIVDNGLWAMVSVDTSLITAPTDISVVINTTCGPITAVMPIDECTLMYEIKVCEGSILEVQLLDVNTGLLPDVFQGLIINGVHYPTSIDLTLLTAGTDIVTYLETEVKPIVGGIFLLQFDNIQEPLKGKIFWVICDIRSFSAEVSTGGIVTTISSTPFRTGVMTATVLFSNPQLVPSFTWSLLGTQILEPPSVLTDQTIVFTGEGEFEVIVNVPGCTTLPTVKDWASDSCSSGRMIDHANVNVIVGGDEGASELFLHLVYKGTGMLVGENIDIDWGDGVTETLVFTENFPALLNTMKITHVYPSNTARYYVSITGADSNLLTFTHTKMVSFNITDAIINNVVPSYTSFFAVQNNITEVIRVCCGNCKATFKSIRYAVWTANQELSSDVIISDQYNHEVFIGDILPPVDLLEVNDYSMTHTFTTTAGTYNASRITTLNDGVNPNYTVESTFQYTVLP